MSARPAQTGFTLVEMAIVLAVVALLLGGILGPLATQREHKKRAENLELLTLAREALIGFAVVNGRLPCPDQLTPFDGTEDSCANNAGTPYIGRLPWNTLGIDARHDAFSELVPQHALMYAVNGAFVDGVSMNRVITLSSTGSGAGILKIFASAPGSCGAAAGDVADNVPAIVWSTARTDYAPASALEQENKDGDRCFTRVDYRTLAAGSSFDDQLLWLSPNVLFNRLVSAGVLP